MDVLFAFVALVLASIAFLRVRDLRERIERLEQDRADRRSLEREPLARGVSTPAPTPAPPPPIPSPPAIASAPEALIPPTPAPARPPPPWTPPPPTAPPTPSGKIEWERWLGVRGAAVLGGIFLAVAGVLFFQYSIERDYITKEMRVALGALVGVACLVGGEFVRRRKYALTANAIAGAGVVILYAAFWSAHLLGIFPFGASFALMVGVTALCCFLSWRHSSQLIAWLGFSGGFATPLLLSTGRDEPIALFSYMMLLDVSFLFIANRRRWPLVGALGLAGTFLIQGAWFFMRMGPATFAIGIVSLGAFAMLFAFLAPSIVSTDTTRRTERLRWLAMRVGALLLPMAFAAHFAGRADVGYHLYPLILLSSLLGAASGWMARKQGATYAPLGAAAGSGAIALVWVFSNQLETARAWELVVCALFACAVLQLFCEWRRAGAGDAVKGHDTALWIAVSGMTVALFGACFNVVDVNVWPLLVGFTLLPLFLLRLDALAPRTARPYLACIPACTAISVWMDAHAGDAGFFGTAGPFAAAMAAPIVLLAAAQLRKEASARKTCFAAAAIACLPLFTAIEIRTGSSPVLSTPFLRALALGVCMGIGASGARSGILLGVGAVAAALAQSITASEFGSVDPIDARAGVAVLLASSAVFALWPLVRRSIWKESRTIAWAAPLATIFWLPAGLDLWKTAYGSAGRAILPAFDTVLLLAAAGWALRDRRGELRAERRAERTTITVLGIHALALASLFLGLAVAQQLDREPWTPTLAAACLGAALVWRKTDHAPLKYAAFVSAALTGVSALYFGLVEPHQAFELPLLSGHGFDFFLPGVAVIAAALCAHALEVTRARPWEKDIYRYGAPLASAGIGLGGLGIVLLWITVEVENHFATGDHFHLEFGDLPARDLSLSIAWAVFAMVLLLVGMRRRVGVLRWVSLVLLLATIGKVFLLDLGDLRDLYRVGSFLGLAVSLLVVSVLYQRFVFKKEARPAA